MEKVLGNKKILSIGVVCIALILTASLLFYFKGRVSSEDWDNVSPGMSKEMVIEYLGNPSSKSIESSEIRSTYSGNLFASAMDTTGKLKQGFEILGYDTDALTALLGLQESGKQVEMYTYKVGKIERYIYFIDDEVFTKL